MVKTKGFNSCFGIILVTTKTHRKEKTPNMSLACSHQKENTFSRLIPKTTFDNDTVSGNLAITYFQAFLEKIGLRQIVANCITFEKHHNSTFNTVDILNFMINASVLGYLRFSHMDVLRKDKVFCEIMNHKVPSEKVCRDLLLNLPKMTATQLRRINKKILEIQAVFEGPREVMLNFDDTVVTVFGHQEGSGVGYNPRYKGRPSFKEKIGMVAGTDEALNVTLENGRNHLNKGFKRFYQYCQLMLPNNWIIKRIRVDRGGFDQDNMEQWEHDCIEYFVKVKMNNSIRKIINYVNANSSQYPWQEIDSIFAVTEITVPLPAWQKARRFILIRKKLLEAPNGQLHLDGDWFRYEYQAIVTNNDYLTPEEVFTEYNQRCDVENNIDELKEGFAFAQNSQQNKKCNELFLLIKLLAYNLQNFFKRIIMPDCVHHHEIKTLRTIFYRVSGNMLGKGKYRHISFPADKFLEKLVEYIRHRLKIFWLPQVSA
jgi:hypothetical protein